MIGPSTFTDRVSCSTRFNQTHSLALPHYLLPVGPNRSAFFFTTSSRHRAIARALPRSSSTAPAHGHAAAHLCACTRLAHRFRRHPGLLPHTCRPGRIAHARPCSAAKPCRVDTIAPSASPRHRPLCPSPINGHSRAALHLFDLPSPFSLPLGSIRAPVQTANTADPLVVVPATPVIPELPQPRHGEPNTPRSKTPRPIRG